jgi:DNA-binding NtrC family response regulator
MRWQAGMKNPTKTFARATCREVWNMAYVIAQKVISTDEAIPRRSAAQSALVVDDDHCVLQVVHEMLEVLGFRTDSANGGHAAMRRLSRSRYDVIVTDLQMPDMDGFALSCWIKHESKDAKVIVMTGSHPSDWVDFIHTGIVDRWISKPFSLTRLAGILDGLVPTDSLMRLARLSGHHGSDGYDDQPCAPQPAFMKEAG